MASAEKVHRAGIDDIGGILELIRPLEHDGILVRRSREQLEQEIEQFTIIERDSLIIGCAALYPFVEEKKWPKWPVSRSTPTTVMVIGAPATEQAAPASQRARAEAYLRADDPQPTLVP